MFFNCSSLWSSIKEIVRQDGILGFFAGLIPKLVCDLSCIVLASTTCFIVHKYYIHDAGSRTYFAGFAQFAYATLLYPLHVVSNCMIVSGSRLQAGNPPQMPVYYNWSHCWKHLHSINEHKRGSSLFWRFVFAVALNAYWDIIITQILSTQFPTDTISHALFWTRQIFPTHRSLVTEMETHRDKSV